jgi:hypothetical protein
MGEAAVCTPITNGFIAESGRFSGELYRKLAPSGPWLAGTPRGEWKDGMGKILNNIIFERTVPTTGGTAGGTDTSWVDEVFSDGGSNDACLPTPEVQQWGQTSRPYNVQARNLQTPEFCVEDLRSDYEIEQMISALMSNLEWGTGYVWEDRDRHEYIRLSDHKVTENAINGFDIEATSFDINNPPTSTLTVGTLEQIYTRLEMDGASVEGASGNEKDSGRPVYDLYTDDVTGRSLIRQDPSLRQDFRFAEPDILLRPLGAVWSWNGYRFVYDRFCERYNQPGGAGNPYVRVPPYLPPQLTATKGYKQDRNPAYLYAQYQISVVHIKKVFRQLVKRPISQLGKFKFNPVKYTGDFQILRIPHKECNPRGTKIFLDAIFASASEPGLTYLGWAVMHKVCPPLRQLRNSCYDPVYEPVFTKSI